MNVVDFVELARRAVACKGWRWMPGMLCSWDPPARSGGQQTMPTSARVADIPTGQLSIMHCVVDKSYVYRAAFPVLTDPATLGCLLHLVREWWKDGGTHTRKLYRYGGGERWVCCSPELDNATSSAWGDTEAEALVKALETEVPKND